MQASFEEAVAGTLAAPQSSRTRRRSDGSRDRRAAAENNPPEARQVGMYLHDQAQPRHRGRTSPRISPIQSPVDANPGRSVEHQSSLRSLLSVSDADIEETIMRQIAEDGLLAGIDLNNLTAPQEDELTERIAQAYRQRRAERRDLRARSADPPSTAIRSSGPSSQSTSSNVNEPRDTLTQTPPNRPRPSPTRGTNTTAGQNQGAGHMSDNPDATSRLQVRQRRRAGSQPPEGRTQESRTPSRSPRRLATSTSNPPAPPVVSAQQPRPTEAERRTTDPTSGTNSRQRRIQNSSITSIEEPRRAAPSRADSDTTSNSTLGLVRAFPRLNSSTFPRDERVTLPSQTLAPNSISRTKPSAPATANVSELPTFYEEPSVTCRHCKKSNVQYEIFYTCTKCDPAGFDVCQKCYRGGKGCNYWFGFGWASMAKYERLKSQNDTTVNEGLPHVLAARRYTRPSSTKAPDAVGKIMTVEEPAKRLQTGVFCDICSESAKSWYWHCTMCNEGEWGFCNGCVNQGKHCTHPLLPLIHETSSNSQQHPTAISAKHTKSLKLPPNQVTPSPPYFAKSFTTHCDICKYLIQPSVSRFHCTQCNSGDYDIHFDCYVSLVKSGQISPDDGYQGWRRCLNGHRMVVLGFEDRDGGRQARIVVRDTAGGQALKEELEVARPAPTRSTEGGAQDSASWSWKDPDGTVRNHRHHSHSISTGSVTRDFPPDGGVGLRLVAAWSYYPDAHVKDELMFPKGAEIREAEDINGDWFWGVYAGKKGLFPGNYARIIGRVSS